MSQVHGLKYLITREGENGRLGKIQGAFQVLETSPLVALLTKEGSRWYLGAKEEWEDYSKAVAGDMDGDGDLDQRDRAIIRDMNRKS